MATPLTDSINALTQYANETTGKSDTTLSDAVGSLVEGYGGGSNVATGTFVGNDTRDVYLNIGFEPDVIVIDTDLNFSTSGWQGIKCIVLVKGVLSTNYCHNSLTDTKEHTYNDAFSANDNPWGSDSGSYRSYGVYTDGTMLITNKNNSAMTHFIDGQTYTWTAYKA